MASGLRGVREPIHKRGSLITQRQYFAHYRAKPDSECELRVRAMALEVLRPQIVVPRGQQLERFLRRFEDIVIARHAGLKEVVHPLTQEMRRRPLYRRMVRLNRTRLKEGLEVSLAGMPELSAARRLPVSAKSVGICSGQQLVPCHLPLPTVLLFIALERMQRTALAIRQAVALCLICMVFPHGLCHRLGLTALAGSLILAREAASVRRC